jgi:hypothetical protein
MAWLRNVVNNNHFPRTLIWGSAAWMKTAN